MSEKNKGFTGKALFLSSIAGGIIGGAVAMLYAPWEGQRTRGKIKEWADEAKEKAEQLSGEVKEKTSSLIEKGKGYVEQKRVELCSSPDLEKESTEDQKKEPIL
jgi:gas vesicle protein